uniref:Uncharacterized protein n=1 Tax=Pipistrellus kuhlii TaxID=59472 RepID=A0A7J7QTC2_PIPKU|nr:hypothetical protein mPipKuh1_008598 [Pipistrellus kuhlii]
MFVSRVEQHADARAPASWPGVTSKGGCALWGSPGHWALAGVWGYLLLSLRRRFEVWRGKEGGLGNSVFVKKTCINGITHVIVKSEVVSRGIALAVLMPQTFEAKEPLGWAGSNIVSLRARCKVATLYLSLRARCKVATLYLSLRAGCKGNSRHPCISKSCL